MWVRLPFESSGRIIEMCCYGRGVQWAETYGPVGRASFMLQCTCGGGKGDLCCRWQQDEVEHEIVW